MAFPAGGTCAGKPCWKAQGTPLGSKGYGYAQKAYATVALTPGEAGTRSAKRGPSSAIALIRAAMANTDVAASANT